MNVDGQVVRAELVIQESTGSDDPKNPGWGWQKNPQTGKKTYKKRPPYICPDDPAKQKMDPFESLEPQMYPGAYAPNTSPAYPGAYAPDYDNMPTTYPGSYAPTPATKAITVGGVIVIIVIVALVPVGA
ncbi:MAG TPA: hypothetical protein VME63_05405 [Dyella sp.]|uniref:hypothetical protein n=1 Tax=Dyella sp. TaxID=1869338 RepID=UPI002C86F9DD|nr:hypothetical protein [Dyella sp.]HTV84818.1 hypothetical protein [Dyella sp.]